MIYSKTFSIYLREIMLIDLLAVWGGHSYRVSGSSVLGCDELTLRRLGQGRFEET